MEKQRAKEIKNLVLAGNTYEKTAEILGISISTVSLYMNGAMRRRKQKYDRKYQTALLRLRQEHREEFQAYLKHD